MWSWKQLLFLVTTFWNALIRFIHGSFSFCDNCPIKSPALLKVHFLFAIYNDAHRLLYRIYIILLAVIPGSGCWYWNQMFQYSSVPYWWLKPGVLHSISMYSVVVWHLWRRNVLIGRFSPMQRARRSGEAYRKHTQIHNHEESRLSGRK